MEEGLWGEGVTGQHRLPQPVSSLSGPPAPLPVSHMSPSEFSTPDPGHLPKAQHLLYRAFSGLPNLMAQAEQDMTVVCSSEGQGPGSVQSVAMHKEDAVGRV